MTPPVLFAFGVHLHQPVGNFDSVFEEHLKSVYQPLLTALEEGPLLPATLHVSGPLLDWLESHAATWLDHLGRLVADGRVELLASGYDEPILAALSRADRTEQIARMRDALARRFGVRPTGLWLTERVWEPDLAGDLARAGVEYVVLDDRHFLTAGFDRHQLHQWFRTEGDGQGIAVFPIDERLRYLIPFRPAAEFATYIAELRAAGHRLAVMADDGEKFGGWPGTWDWVYERGRMRSWLDTVAGLVADGALRPVTLREALDTLPSGGIAYPASASYREMEAWALPPRAAGRLAALEAELGAERLAGPDGALVRGSHWRHFLVRYPEANRLHKKMMRLSARCRAQGDPEDARRAIGRAQCNDPYWHGVFGGLYLPFLRAAAWGNLAVAEAILRRGEGLSWERADADGDGHDEILVHAQTFAAVVAPARGGSLEEYLRFETGVNYADVLTRRREAYHEAAPAASAGEPGDGMPSIHHLEKHLAMEAVPPVDRDPRAMFQERLLPRGVGRDRWAAGDWEALRSWAGEPFGAEVAPTEHGLVVTLTATGLVKRYRFDERGLEVELEWDPPADAEDAVFTTELSLAAPLELAGDAEDRWSCSIETLAKSERGFDRVSQGESVMLLWPAGAGRGRVSFPS
jgi:hypothetical protein